MLAESTLIDEILADEDRELEAIISNLEIEDREMEDAPANENKVTTSQQTSSPPQECLGCGLDELMNLGNECVCFNCGWTYNSLRKG